MTFKYTEIACYQEGPDGVPIVQHERVAESLEDAVAALDDLKAADADIQYVVIREQGQIYPCWDTRVGAVSQPVAVSE
ncbi:MAG: hypothetical protein E6R08_11345 [Nevskiaceae bacterium]|nr:MAG: hypothetical protein E6R08_11345 [Nevskiaceae bacterium]